MLEIVYQKEWFGPPPTNPKSKVPEMAKMPKMCEVSEVCEASKYPIKYPTCQNSPKIMHLKILQEGGLESNKTQLFTTNKFPPKI